MAQLKYIIASTAASDRQTMGGKAAALAELGAENFKIPEWFVISPQTFLECLSKQQLVALKKGESIGMISYNKRVEKAIKAAAGTLVKDKNQLLAVRSSATAEDGEEASFAGQLESYLNISTVDVLEKVREVWYSAFSEHVTHYRQTFGQGEGEDWIPAVLVQRMVNADMAGVAFSADPVTGNRNRCVINATLGLADKLVSGEVNGDTYYTLRDGTMEKQSLEEQSAILNQKQITEIIALLLRVEQHFGLPQDIEWAIEDGILYLIQARPITSLKHLSIIGEQVTIWDNSNIVESYSGVTSPLTFSFARYVYEHVYIEFCRFMGVSQTRIESENAAFRNMLGFVNGHVYYNLLNWYRVLALFPGFKMNRNFMEQMMGVKEPLPEDVVKSIVAGEPTRWEKITDGANFIRTLLGLIKHQLTLRTTISRFYERLEDALSSSEQLGEQPLDRLGEEYRTLEDKLLKKWDAPLINDFLCMIAFGLSRKLLEKYAGDEGLNLHNDIMIGQGDIISAEPAIRIGKMAVIAAKDAAIVQRLIAGDETAIDTIPKLKAEYYSYLEKFGDRCLQELKLESHTLHDEPTMLLQAIGHMASREKKPEMRHDQKDIKSNLAEILKHRPVITWAVSKAVLWAKARVRDRENLRFERTRVFGRVRQIILEIGRRFHELKYIAHPRDIFFLELSEIMGQIEGTSTIMDSAALVEMRKQQQQEFESQPTPPYRFETYGSACHSFKNQAYNLESSDILDSTTVQGIGCCQGIVNGPVRVIHNPRDAELKPGEIMVAQFTDPGWITLFANASGILVERGSLLSHSAIVAREMGIPAIVAIDNVMTWLKTGDVVEMNGATGSVKRMEGEIKNGQE